MYELFTKFWLAVVNSTAGWPQSRRTRLANAAAAVLWWAVPKRRHVTLTNLRLCFPEKTEQERIALARATYRNLARAALDHGKLWKASAQELNQWVHFDGLENLSAGRPMLAIAPHFAGLDAAGITLNTHVRGASLYQKQSNPIWDKAALEGRKRFSDPVLISKSGGSNDLRQVLRALKDGLPFYYLPDMDHGRKNSIFVPFFGQQAATLPMASRLARLTHAKVVMVITEMTEEGYLVHISKPWDDFPTSDPQADTALLMSRLEEWVRKIPDQYMWTHRRFKTRPDGMPPVY